MVHNKNGLLTMSMVEFCPVSHTDGQQRVTVVINATAGILYRQFGQIRKAVALGKSAFQNQNMPVWVEPGEFAKRQAAENTGAQKILP